MTDAQDSPAQAATIDLDLLRRFEPVLRFTNGELFFPMPTDGYVAECDLLAATDPTDTRVLVPHGDLSLARLAEVGDGPPGETRFLRFVQSPLSPIDLTRWSTRPGRPSFHAPGRLARVGLAARLLDAAMVVSLLVRGKVPGGTAAAAQIKYEAIRAADPRVSYHGRVVRAEGWIALQYLFFYAMNDWRTTFEGANDHEADWEQAFVILEDVPGGDPRPAWFAAAAHDEKGDDLRRRWDDPRLEKDGDHPVVYPGAGSHATYLERGEYIMRLPLPGEHVVHGILDSVRRFWRDTLDQPDPGDIAERVKRIVSVPFVDYARGDGPVVGPGGDVEWTPIVIGDDVAWVDGYSGLWGLDTGDRLAGERAPAGPKYTRTGSVRQSWNDPLSFFGLAKVPPRSRSSQAIDERVAALRAELDRVEGEEERLARILPGLDLEVEGLRKASGLDTYRERRVAELKATESELAGLRASHAELVAAIAATQRERERLLADDVGDPRAHLTHAAAPEPPDLTRRRMFAETWAALSVGLLVLVLAAILWFRVLTAGQALLFVGLGYLAIESFARRSVETLLLRLVVILAVIAALVLLYTYLREIVLIGLAALGVFILLDNVRELRRR
jgi:hypothetical protein